MSAFSGRGRVYLAAASILAWIFVLRAVVLPQVLPLVPQAPVNQSALVAGNTPLNRHLVLGWCLGPTGAILIGAFFVRPFVRRQARRRRGLCVVCGYDVGATGYPRQNRCPECGETTLSACRLANSCSCQTGSSRAREP